MDTDLRLGAQNIVLNLPAGHGLAELLSNQDQQPAIQSLGTVPNLDILQAGAAPPNPSELLGSASFGSWLSTWREQYDYVVLDSAPLLPVTDSLTLAPLSDMTLLIVRLRLTEKAQLARSYQLLARSSKHVIATVLNGLLPEEEGYSGYFGYHNTTDKYGQVVKAKRVLLGR